MTRKAAGLLLGLALAASSGAAALPLSHLEGLAEAGSAAQQVHYRRSWHRWWHGCPFWYERTFWGAYRLYSPCSKRVTTHAY